MKTHRDDFDLAAELRALRPAPRHEFADELDARAASGFASQTDPEATAWQRLVERVRAIGPRNVLVPVTASVLLAVVVATAVIVNERPGPDENRGQVDRLALENRSPSVKHQFSDALPNPGAPPSESSLKGGAGAGTQSTKPSAGAEGGLQYESAPATGSGQAPATGNRDVERGAELVLRSNPGEVEGDARQVFAAVRTAHGIVLNSSVHDQAEGDGESTAEFHLLIPSAKLGDAMASLSRIGAVSSRHESTADITAPTVTARDRLRGSEAKIDGLLAQLAGAESDEERTAVERDLRRERRIAASLRARLDRLHRRARYARVTVRIEGDQAAGGSAGWGVGDALDDAARILVVVAGVVLIGLAVVGPLALIALLAWLAHRIWLRRRREAALG